MSGSRARRSRVLQPEYGVYREVVAERQVCPGCGYATDSASETTGRGRPKAGDCGLCLNCGAVEVYTGDGLSKRPPTGAELAEFESDPRVAGLRRVILDRGRFWPREPS